MRTGMESKKCTKLFPTTARGKAMRGNFTFLIRLALPKKTVGEVLTELANHCQGKSPLKRKAI